MSKTTWRKLLNEARSGDADFDVEPDGSPIIAYAPDEATFDIEFDDGYGGSEGPDVLAWSERFVYFPVVYDGAEWLGRAPRNPQGMGQAHVGGQ